MGDHVKDFEEVQIDDICSSSLVYSYSHCITEGHKVGQAGLALGEAMLAVSNHLPVLHVP